MKIQYIIFYSIIALGFSSCKDDPQAIQPIGKLATVQLVFDNVVGDKDLLLDSTEYVNLFEQAFTVAKFNYFISNIELKMKDGTYVPVLQDSSYFLVKEKDPSSLIANLNWVNEGEYAGIRFMIGVDSLRNTMPLDFRTGMLDIGGFASDMYWTWNQGYIFMKLECHKPQSKGDPNPAIPYVYHIGGFGIGTGKTNLNAQLDVNGTTTLSGSLTLFAPNNNGSNIRTQNSSLILEGNAGLFSSFGSQYLFQRLRINY